MAILDTLAALAILGALATAGACRVWPDTMWRLFRWWMP
jgi:hypothetical protein